MPQVALPHVIGTVTLIGLLGIVIFYANDLNMHVKFESAKTQLRDISEYVSSEIIAMANIANLGHNSSVIYRVIDIPDDVNGYGYAIEIVNDSGAWIVRAYLDRYPSIKAESYLYLSGGINISTDIEIIQVDNGRIITGYKLYSGVRYPVVWCRFEGMNVTIGIGRFEVS